MLQRIFTYSFLAIAVTILAGCPSGGGGGGGKSLQQKYQEALNIASPTSRANRLIEVARDQHAAGDINGVRTSLDAAFTAASEGSDPAPCALAFNGLAAAEAEFGSKAKAEDALKEARKAAAKIEVPSIKVEQLGAIAVTFGAKLDDASKASVYLGMAREAAEEIEDPAMRAEAIISLADSYHTIGDATEAEAFITAATDAAKTIEDKGVQAKTLIGIANRVLAMQQGDQAQQLCDEAVQVVETSDNNSAKAHVLVEAAMIVKKSGDAARAKELIKQATAAADKISDPGLKTEAQEKIGRIGSQI